MYNYFRNKTKVSNEGLLSNKKVEKEKWNSAKAENESKKSSEERCGTSVIPALGREAEKVPWVQSQPGLCKRV